MRRDRALVGLGLVAIVAPAWVYLVLASLDMYGAMDGLSAWMMRARWDASFTVLIFAMWAVMMAGMMLPSAAPAILIYARVARSGARPERTVLRTYLFAAGYLVVWMGFSLAATLLQRLLAAYAIVTPMMESATPLFAAALLALAGLYSGAMPSAPACVTVADRSRSSRATGAAGQRARCGWALRTVSIASAVVGP